MTIFDEVDFSPLMSVSWQNTAPKMTNKKIAQIFRRDAQCQK